MTDADALDETEFSHVMMGYAEGRARHQPARTGGRPAACHDHHHPDAGPGASVRTRAEGEDRAEDRGAAAV